MKRFFYLAFAALAVFACTPEEKPADNGKEEQKPGTEEQTDNTGYDSITAVLKASTIKTAWAEGDEIMVVGVPKSGADVTAKYVLSAGAGTANGTFVPASGVSALAKGAKAYYATYPYNEDLSLMEHALFQFQLPSEQVNPSPLFSYAKDAATLEFSSVLGAIKFTLTGKADISSITIEDANKAESLFGNVSFEPASGDFSITNGSPSKYVVKLLFAQKISINNATSDPIIVEVPAGKLNTGAVITLYDVEDQPISTVNVPAQTITAGAVADAGNFDFVTELATKDLSADGYANCYILRGVGKYKFEAVKGNDSSAKLADADSAVVLWETWCDSLDVTPKSLVKSISLEDGCVLIETADDYHEGDALVAVKDASGKILWSWTLWFTDDVIETKVIGETTIELMDRNLGALTAAKDQPGYNYGLLYQWGRHTGFPACDGSKTGKNAKTAPAFADTFTYEGLSAAGEKSVQDAIENPTVFFGGKTHWTGGGAEEEELWSNDGKTLYDPCPAGYKVPSYEYSSGPFASINTKDVEAGYNFIEGVGIEMDGLFYPFAGYIKYSTNLTEKYNADGAYGMYWTGLHKTGNDGVTYENAQSMQASSQKQSYDRKASAFSIRCQKLTAE